MLSKLVSKSRFLIILAILGSLPAATPVDEVIIRLYYRNQSKKTGILFFQRGRKPIPASKKFDLSSRQKSKMNWGNPHIEIEDSHDSPRPFRTCATLVS